MAITEQIVLIIISLVAMLTIVTVVRMLTDASVKKAKYWAIESSEDRKRKEAELKKMRLEYVKPAAEVATAEVKADEYTDS
jgi:RNA 3'-terminal phosphate cyclase